MNRHSETLWDVIWRPQIIPLHCSYANGKATEFVGYHPTWTIWRLVTTGYGWNSHVYPRIFETRRWQILSPTLMKAMNLCDISCLFPISVETRDYELWLAEVFLLSTQLNVLNTWLKISRWQKWKTFSNGAKMEKFLWDTMNEQYRRYKKRKNSCGTRWPWNAMTTLLKVL